MLYKDKWPEFYKEAAEYFNSLGFRFEPLSSEMAMQIGRTDQVTFVLIAKYLETLSNSLPQEDAYEKMISSLGDFGGLLLENLRKYPGDYQYIFYIAHQTQPEEVFKRMMDLGVTTMMFIDAQAEAARVDLKDEALLMEFMNECVITLSKLGTEQIMADLGAENVADNFNIELMLETLVVEAKTQYKFSRNVILN